MADHIVKFATQNMAIAMIEVIKHAILQCVIMTLHHQQ